MMTRKLRILIVEDEAPILQGLIDVFVYHNYEVDFASDGKAALEKALKGKYDLVILDVMLPSLDGFTICDELRKADRAQPIIMLTAKSSDDDIITGLRLGADDYVSKPFSVRELVLRVEAVLRRSQKLQHQASQLSLAGYLRIDTLNLIGHYETTGPDGQTQAEFTRREVDILQYLLEHADRPVSRGELLEEVWGYARASQIETRTVDIHIAKLRRKIEREAQNPSYLVTIRGEGYKLFPAGLPSAHP